MPEKHGRIFCQRCLAANSLAQELCSHCGTRLMLVVEPSSLRFEEDAGAAADYEEHLLERVSALENSFARIAERLEQGLDLLLRQSRSSYYDHALLETLIAVLGETGAVKQGRLEKLWRKRCEQDALIVDARERHAGLCARVLADYGGPERELFAGLIREGFARLEEDKVVKGVRALERAAALAPGNAPLNAFLGEHFFKKGRTALAEGYLSRALAADPEDGRVRLLLGLSCGDEGEAARAKELLSEAVRRGDSSFAVHFALGRLSAAESDWKAALAQFKRALSARPCPEAHYVIGLVYYQLGRDRLAQRHLARAVEMELEYAEAFYLLGLVHLRTGQRERAAEAFDAALALDSQEPRYRNARRKMARSIEFQPPPLFVETGRGKRRLVTGGDNRLAAALQEDALRRAASR
jgi:tetratricopeptide (TPR) repeat protein